ncbi:MAG: phosphoribosylanthranilate isomerase [Bacteroidota bacterium]
MKVKVCGLRAEENIKQLQKLPIDMMGFIFYKGSPRNMSDQAALKELLADDNWNPEIKKVGVFVNAQIHDVLHEVHDFHLDYVQLHGNESPEYCHELNTLWSISSVRQAKIIKAFSIADAIDFQEVQRYESHCAFFLFDTKGKNPGGNGIHFDWQLLDNYRGITPFLLSGGISEEDVTDLRKLQVPQLYGVDVNSKFEIEPGLKDVKRIEQFVKLLNA